MREQSRRGPGVHAVLGRELPRQAVHGALSELHPPHRVRRLIVRASRARRRAEFLDLLERARVGLARQRWWWRRPELTLEGEHEGLRKPKPGLRHEAIPGRRRLVLARPAPKLVGARQVEAIACSLRQDGGRRRSTERNAPISKRAVRHPSEPDRELGRQLRLLIRVSGDENLIRALRGAATGCAICDGPSYA